MQAHVGDAPQPESMGKQRTCAEHELLSVAEAGEERYELGVRSAHGATSRHDASPGTAIVPGAQARAGRMGVHASASGTNPIAQWLGGIPADGHPPPSLASSPGAQALTGTPTVSQPV